MNRFRYGPRLAIPLAALVLSVSACGSSENPTSGDSAPAPAAAQDAGANTAGGAVAESQTARAQASEGGTDPSKTGRVQVVPQDRAIVYTAEMTVRAKDVTVAADKARRLVTTAGGYLAMEKSGSFSGGEGSATLVFKIPPGAYPGAVDRLGKDLGTRESLQQNTEDVTEQVADVESRLKSAKAALDSLRTLMKRAETIGQVLEVEREVSNRESELESLQARQKSLASQTSMATLTLNLVGPAAVIPEVEEESSGFLAGLEAGWNGFVTTVKVVLTVLGALLPWLIVIVPVWLLVAFVLRRNRRNAPPARPVRPHESEDEDEDEAVPYERP